MIFTRDPIAELINVNRERIESHIGSMVRNVILDVDGLTIVSNQLIADYLNDNSDRYNLVCVENHLDMNKHYYITVDGIKRAELTISYNVLAAPYEYPLPEVRYYGSK